MKFFWLLRDCLNVLFFWKSGGGKDLETAVNASNHKGNPLTTVDGKNSGDSKSIKDVKSKKGGPSTSKLIRLLS